MFERFLPWVSMFLLPRVPPCFWKIFRHQSSPLGLGIFFVTKGPPLGLEDFLLSRVLPWVWKIFHHQGSPLGFGRFFVTKGPPLGLGDFLSFSLVFERFYCYQGFSLGFHVFVTKGSPLCLEGLHLLFYCV